MDALRRKRDRRPAVRALRREMTTARGACAHCGAPAQIAELRVYVRRPAPSYAAAACDSVVIVVVEIEDTLRVDATCFRLEPSSGR